MHSFITQPLFPWWGSLQPEGILFIAIAVKEAMQFLSGSSLHVNQWIWTTRWVQVQQPHLPVPAVLLEALPSACTRDAEARFQQFLVLTMKDYCYSLLHQLWIFPVLYFFKCHVLYSFISFFSQTTFLTSHLFHDTLKLPFFTRKKLQMPLALIFPLDVRALLLSWTGACSACHQLCGSCYEQRIIILCLLFCPMPFVSLSY